MNAPDWVIAPGQWLVLDPHEQVTTKLTDEEFTRQYTKVKP